MGSSQSRDLAQQQAAAPMMTSTDSPARAANADSNSNSSSNDGSRNEEVRRREGGNKTNDKSSQLTGFDLIQYQCRKKKRKYDRCYRSWYGSTFAQGQLDKDAREDCDDLFEAYQNCILMSMKKDRDRRGVGKANEDSAIGTFEAELEYENDEE